MLVDGEWRTDTREMTDDTGEFQRTTTSFRDAVRDDPGARFQPEAGRYHLYVARACPWAHGAAMVRRLMGLEDAISIDIVDPVRENDGWEFAPEKAGCTVDSILGADYLREVYVAADSDYTGRVTVPVLWDRQQETIVNNESIEIMRTLSRAFGDVGNGVDLYPEGHREAIDNVVKRYTTRSTTASTALASPTPRPLTRTPSPTVRRPRAVERPPRGPAVPRR